MPFFLPPGDYDAFERVLIEAIERHPIRLLGYCIMPNHWPLAFRPLARARRPIDGFSSMAHAHPYPALACPLPFRGGGRIKRTLSGHASIRRLAGRSAPNEQTPATWRRICDRLADNLFHWHCPSISTINDEKRRLPCRKVPGKKSSTTRSVGRCSARSCFAIPTRA